MSSADDQSLLKFYNVSLHALEFFMLCVDDLHTSQQFLDQVWTISCLPGLNHGVLISG